MIGSGAREHALVWKCVQSDLVERVYCAPGNGGTGGMARNIAIGAADVVRLVSFAKRERACPKGAEPPLPMLPPAEDLAGAEAEGQIERLVRRNGQDGALPRRENHILDCGGDGTTLKMGVFHRPHPRPPWALI